MTGVDLIAEERRRQVEAEGWTPQHDDTHTGYELTLSAVAYALESTHLAPQAVHFWPFGSCERKTGDPIRNLVKAGALIAAEIDRLSRADQ